MPPIDNLAGTDTERAPDDLRGELESAWAVEETGDGHATEPSIATVQGNQDGAEKAAAPEVNTEKDSGRVRGADGKFTKSTEKAVAAEPAPATQDLPSTDIPAKASDAVSASSPNAPPGGWTAEGKAAWDVLAKELPTLSPAAQAAVRSVQTAALAREQSAAAGSNQWSEEKRRYEAALSPIAQLARARGISAEEGAQRLAQAQQMLDADPVNGIRKLAASYGVNLATIAGQQPAEGSSDQNPHQPDISALVRAHVEPLLAPIRQQREFEQRQREDQTVETVTQFATSPGHEHFDAVQTELMALIPAIKGQNPGWSHEKVLQDAYDRAVHANPATRAAITTAARDAEATRLRIEATARTDRARRAGASVTGSPSGSASSAPKDSIRGELEAAFSGSN